MISIRILLILLMLTSFCKTRHNREENLSAAKTSASLELAPSEMNLYSFNMSELDFVVAAFQRNVRACPGYDKREAAKDLIATLKKYQIQFGLVKLDKNNTGLGLVTADKQVVDLLTEDFTKYGIVFFSASSRYTREYKPAHRVLVFSKKTGWTTSRLLEGNLFTTGITAPEMHVILENYIPLAQHKEWGLIYNPDALYVGFEEQEKVLQNEIESSMKSGKTKLIVPVYTPDHAMTAIVDFSVPGNRIEFYESNGQGKHYLEEDPWVKRTMTKIQEVTKTRNPIENVITVNHQGTEKNPIDATLSNPNCGIYGCYFAKERVERGSFEKVREIKTEDIGIFERKFEMSEMLDQDVPTERFRDTYVGELAVLNALELDEFQVENGLKSTDHITPQKYVELYEDASKLNILRVKKSQFAYLEWASHELTNKKFAFDIATLDSIFRDKYDVKLTDAIRGNYETLKTALEEEKKLAKLFDTPEWNDDAKNAWTKNQALVDAKRLSIKVEIDKYRNKYQSLPDEKLLSLEEKQKITSDVNIVREKFKLPLLDPPKADIPEGKVGYFAMAVGLSIGLAAAVFKGATGLAEGTTGLEFNAQTCKQMSKLTLDSELRSLSISEQLAELTTIRIR